MMTFRSEDLRPELPGSSAFPSSVGAPLDVAVEPGTANKAVEVIIFVTDVPPLTTTTVLTTSWDLLLTTVVGVEETGPAVVRGFCRADVVSVVSVTIVDSTAGAEADTSSGVLLDTKVEGSSWVVGDAEVDCNSDVGLGVSEDTMEDSGGSLADVEVFSGASDEVGVFDVARADVALLADAPVPFGTTCRYRSALSTLSADTIVSEAKASSSNLLNANDRFISACC
jgi:hypothetical protein